MSDTTTTPTPEQEQRAKWDLMLRDFELKHADIVLKQEQLQQMKTFPLGKFEGWKLVFAGMTAFAITFVAGATAGVSTVFNILHWMGRLP